MAQKITFAGAVKVAKALGYAGPEKFEDVTKFLSESDGKVLVKGDELMAKALLVQQPDAKTVVVAQVDDGDMAVEDSAKTNKSAKSVSLDEVENIVRSRIDDAFVKSGKAEPVVTGGESVEYAEYNANANKVFKDAKHADLFLAGVMLGKDVTKGIGNTEHGREVVKRSLDTLKRFAPNVHKDYSTGVGSLDIMTLPGVNADVIRLFNEFGDIAPIANVVSQPNDQEINRWRNLTERRSVTYPNENTQPTSAADSDWRSYTTRLRMAMSLTRVSLSASRFSRLSIADEVARDFAQDFAAAEDDAALNGTGTSAYGGMIGLATQFGSVGFGTARGAVSAGTNWAAYSLTTFQTIKSRLPRYAYRRGAGPVWLTTQDFYEGTMMPLARAAGGVTAEEIANFNQARFLGHPVVTTPLMNTNSDVSTATIDVYLGNFSLGLDLGRGSGMLVEADPSAGFTTAATFIRGLFWHGVQCEHAVGSATVAGPIVCGYSS
jgi:HK97 family phage major capsid protein